MTRRSASHLLLRCALLAALVFGCVAERPVEGTRPVQQDIVTVNFSPSLSHAPWIIGREAGFFAQEGIDLRLANLEPNSALVSLVNGQVDVVSTGLRSGLFNLMLRGAPLRVVADRGHASDSGGCAPGAFVAPAAVAKQIERAGGRLDGQKFAMYRGGINEYLTDRLLESRGTSRDRIHLVQLPQGDYQSRLAAGTDAIRYLQEPTLSQMLANGEASVIARDSEFAPRNQHGVVLFGRRLLRDDRELGVRVMRAWLRSVARYSEGKTDRNIAALVAHLRLPETVVRDACWVEFNRNGVVQFDSVESLLSWATARGYLDGAVDRSLWWDPEFTRLASAGASP